MGGNPVQVSGTPDGNYDLIFYEWDDGTGSVYLDHIIIGISNATDGSYYEVFNRGDNNPDENTNVDTSPTIPPHLPNDPGCSGADAPECDNRYVPATTPPLYTDPVSGISTGILIDVDNAGGSPPEGFYGYLVIISPAGGYLDPAQVDAVVVAEVPGGKSALAKEEPVLSAEKSSGTPAEAPDLSAESPASPPAEEAPSPPEENVLEPPAEEAPAPAVEGSPDTP